MAINEKLDRIMHIQEANAESKTPEPRPAQPFSEKARHIKPLPLAIAASKKKPKKPKKSATVAATAALGEGAGSSGSAAQGDVADDAEDAEDAEDAGDI